MAHLSLVFCVAAVYVFGFLRSVSSSSAVIGLMGSEPVSVIAEPKKHFMNVNATAFESAVTFNSIPNNMTNTEQETSVEDTGEPVHEDESQYNSPGDNQGNCQM